MTPFQRNLNRAAVVLQTIAAAFWVHYFVNFPGMFGLLGFTWCVAWALYSVRILREEKKQGVEL